MSIAGGAKGEETMEPGEDFGDDIGRCLVEGVDAEEERLRVVFDESQYAARLCQVVVGGVDDGVGVLKQRLDRKSLTEREQMVQLGDAVLLAMTKSMLDDSLQIHRILCKISFQNATTEGVRRVAKSQKSLGIYQPGSVVHEAFVGK